jgi:hypothetical protein
MLIITDWTKIRFKKEFLIILKWICSSSQANTRNWKKNIGKKIESGRKSWIDCAFTSHYWKKRAWNKWIIIGNRWGSIRRNNEWWRALVRAKKTIIIKNVLKNKRRKKNLNWLQRSWKCPARYIERLKFCANWNIWNNFKR